MLGKFVLWLSAIVFMAFGLVCLFSPALPANYAGLEFVTGDAMPEIGAMYGGLQTGFGLFCLVAALKPAHYRSGLLLLVVAIGLLAVGRLYSTLVGTSEVGLYTWGAITYEFATAIIALIALRKS